LRHLLNVQETLPTPPAEAPYDQLTAEQQASRHFAQLSVKLSVFATEVESLKIVKDSGALEDVNGNSFALDGQDLLKIDPLAIASLNDDSRDYFYDDYL